MFVFLFIKHFCTTLDALHNHISRYASAAAEKLRTQYCKASAITVFIQTSPFDDNYYGNSTTRSLSHPTDDTRVLIQHARLMMTKIFQTHRRYQRCGFGIIDLVDASHLQHDLFHPGQSYTSEALMNVVDRINKRYGRDTAIFGSEGINGKWTMRQHYLSPRYSTNWKDLPRIRM